LNKPKYHDDKHKDQRDYRRHYRKSGKDKWWNDYIQNKRWRKELQKTGVKHRDIFEFRQNHSLILEQIDNNYILQIRAEGGRPHIVTSIKLLKFSRYTKAKETFCSFMTLLENR